MNIKYKYSQPLNIRYIHDSYLCSNLFLRKGHIPSRYKNDNIINLNKLESIYDALKMYSFEKITINYNNQNIDVYVN